MNYQKLLQIGGLALSLLGSVNAQANLVVRGPDMIYDEDLNVTWLQNANLSGITWTWQGANDWASNLNIGGYTDWRLPTTLQTTGAVTSASEVGHLFIDELGGTPTVLLDWSNNSTNYELFQNIVLSGSYWTATESADDSRAFSFTTYGFQGSYDKATNQYYAWAVRDGDVWTVPLPGSAWLFVSFLFAFLGIERRKFKA